MERPYIVRFERTKEFCQDAVIHCESCATATQWAREYFGDRSTDVRNRNTVEYLYSDFEGNHTYRVTEP